MRRDIIILAGGAAALALVASAYATPAGTGEFNDAGSPGVDPLAGGGDAGLALEPGQLIDQGGGIDGYQGPAVSPDQNIGAFLAMIRGAEGTAGPDGYRTIIGGQLLGDFADHPRVRVPFTQTDGKQNFSTAAGAYQFLAATWDRLALKLGLPDFTPASQDAAAIELLREAGALLMIEAGRFDEAVAKVNRIWASLPGAPYKQRTRTVAFVRSAYEQAGGTYV